jgi:16S rRNA processing protein RimM
MSTSTSLTPDPATEVRQIGVTHRAHGVRGEMSVELFTDRQDRLAPGSAVRVGDRWHTVETSRKLPDRWLVRFAGVADRSAAEELAHTALFAVADDGGDPDALWVHELVGSHVVDQHGVDRGVCMAVVANPAHDLLELDSGALVPVVFVDRVADGVIDVVAPDGLFD